MAGVGVALDPGEANFGDQASLGEDDAAEMLALAALTRPGPFFGADATACRRSLHRGEAGRPAGRAWRRRSA